ncbi:hypothetical protein Leryth_007764 [Lithospermum erythrorhizon]|nr:hypothetical protein Leryth_007764 [Lithospermum erythrorhizon]
MAEALSPNPNPRPVFLSPTSPFLLGSNDDNLERARARAARAASIRRKSVVATTTFVDPVDCVLDKSQIVDLFNNCIKLATENKINQKNTWELKLIDHLHDIIKIEESGTETNFQKASCTLEAGVKIYSLRVDSVHAEAYKVLGGINRVGQEDGQDNVAEDASDNVGREEGTCKKVQEKKLSPLMTLESSFEALNVKKFDVAFAVDPLYHQTTAQFDEGGAKGLLLNNLGVYDDCRVLFDSQDIPGKSTSSIRQNDSTETIDLSFARECIEQMVNNMSKDDIISPSLAYILDQFGEGNKRRTETCSASQFASDQVGETFTNNNDFDDNENVDSGTWTMDQDDQTDGVDEGAYADDPIFRDQHEDEGSFSYHEPDMDDRFEEVDDFLSISLGFSSKHNAWAGPEHWKYRKSKVPEEAPDETRSPVKSKNTKSKKAESNISFTSDLDCDMSHIFAPPKNSKSILLPANREASCTKLPEDCHYQPEDLVKLFLRPNMMCLGTKGRRGKYVPNQGDGYEATPSWDEGDEYHGGDCIDDRDACSDVDDSITLVSQPRQVSKIDVHYDKTSKQVDVQMLKETLWNHIQEQSQSYQQEEVLSFSQALSSFPNDCRAAPSLKDISTHLCFICLLHLANEHGLRIEGCADLDDLRIYIQANQTSED